MARKNRHRVHDFGFDTFDVLVCTEQYLIDMRLIALKDMKQLCSIQEQIVKQSRIEFIENMLQWYRYTFRKATRLAVGEQPFHTPETP